MLVLRARRRKKPPPRLETAHKTRRAAGPLHQEGPPLPTKSALPAHRTLGPVTARLAGEGLDGEEDDRAGAVVDVVGLGFEGVDAGDAAVVVEDEEAAGFA